MSRLPEQSTARMSSADGAPFFSPSPASGSSPALPEPWSAEPPPAPAPALSPDPSPEPDEPGPVCPAWSCSPPPEELPDPEEPSEDEPDAGDGEKKGAPSALDILAVDCSGSRLTAHDGFQKAPRCVSTAFGEVADADRSPSLLITQAPTTVRPGESFRLTVSTRNLVRDRFLPAAQGGYYAEASLLDGQGLQRGHFHTACRILPDPGEAPDSSPDPLFFQATEDGGGGARPDSVTIDVPGVEQTGELQCSSWAGDGSHRTPMMQRANQTPAFDSVRIEVG
ncbi:hypothetical protein [Pseudonocardia sp. UM4_GMWB1]|uniref:hypothetical protein n=1 Tax=Pseudonocardia sp. UM4_GMWB1 TaxID=2212989 RepID=UPI00307F7064